MRRALIFVVLCGGCGAHLAEDMKSDPAAPDAPIGSVAPDAATPDAPAADAAPDSAMATYMPWGTPTPITGVNTASSEDDPSFTADRLQLAYTSNASGNADIYLGTRADVTAAFTTTALTTVNSTSTDASPEISADGKTLYFTSNRSGAFDVYVSTWSGTAWTTPTVVKELSTANPDSDVAISPDGLTALVIQTTTPHRVMIATRATTADVFGTLAEVPELEVTADVAAPTLTDGGATVYLHAGAPRDVYVSHYTNGHYSTPTMVTELYSDVRDAAPFVSAHDDHLVYAHAGDLYETSR